MSKTNSLCITPKNFQDYKILGIGNNGTVYLTPDRKALKVFNRTKVCNKELLILKRACKSTYFPKIYEYGKNYILRDYVNGICLKNYIQENGLDIELYTKIIDILKEFKKLKFEKIDVRCKDIFILEDSSLMIIDPKNYCTKSRDYPRHLCKGLNNLGVLDKFMGFLKKENPKLYRKWSYKIYEYLYERSSFQQ